MRGDAAYQRCLDIDACIHFPPEEDRDLPGYCELFIFDPDGIRIEVACTPPESIEISGGHFSMVEEPDVLTELLDRLASDVIASS